MWFLRIATAGALLGLGAAIVIIGIVKVLSPH
jgi:hypothetical protein